MPAIGRLEGSPVFNVRLKGMPVPEGLPIHQEVSRLVCHDALHSPQGTILRWWTVMQNMCMPACSTEPFHRDLLHGLPEICPVATYHFMASL